MKKSRLLTFAIITAFAVALIPTLSCSCTRTVYVPLQNTSVRTDTMHHIVSRRDTVIMRDSVTTCIKGDTLIRTVVRDRIRTHFLHDTVNRILRDTVVREVLPATLPTATTTTAISSLRRTNAAGLITFLIVLVALSAYIAYRRINRKN